MAMAPRTAPARQNLPQESDSFIGRERDLGDLLRLLAADRVVTLCGVGGVGKTRLALKVAAHATAAFRDGVWLAEMSGVSTPHEVAARVAAAVGVTEETGRPLAETLRDALRTRRVLLILDDCTRAAADAAGLGAALTRSCPDVTLLITADAPIGLPGEAVWHVPPLALPGEEGDPREAEAVRLFLDRARTADPDFSADPEAVAAAARICRSLDGVPLALELVAAWLRRMPVHRAEALLAEALHPSGAPPGARGAEPPRPREAEPDRAAPRARLLRAALEQSHALLGAEERVLLRRLSVFADWTLESAERVCPDAGLPESAVLDLVSSLAEWSLIALTREFQGRVRYRLPGAVRAFAAERLAAAGEEEAVRLRHRDHMLRITEEMGASSVGGRLMPWAERFAHWLLASVEYDDIRAVLHWTAERRDTEEGLRLCAALRPYWGTGYHFTEGMGWTERFLAMPGGSGPVRARASVTAAELSWARGDLDSALHHGRTALRLAEDAGDDPTAAAALNMLALAALRSGEPEEAAGHLERTLALARRSGDLWNEAIALSTRGALAARHGNFAEADALYSAALMILRGMDHRWGVGVSLIGQATAAERQSDIAVADRCYRESLDIQREIGAAPELARCLFGVGRIAHAFGSTSQAYDYLAEGLLLSQSTGQRTGVAAGLASIARVAAGSGEVRGGCILAGAAAALRERAEPGRPPRPPAVKGEEFGIDSGTLSSLLREGRRLPVDEAVGLALRITETGRLPRQRQPERKGPRSTRRALTPREREIARLVARGMGNREISERLFITPATVARHVANINRKLGFHSRKQIAAWVTRSPLPE
ncbi:LuxR C-terminal-related transcriptional regulator [Nocardiopsis potens]|uniref:LuxR C-terminal-related transcriptional regulator n=1 Tax=Nocardiopsis potens TaxID=1246458 RepID=UPI0003758FEE|nr:LuxR C-terminal-related transcriptional regulator [Nocardiopsis potens]